MKPIDLSQPKQMLRHYYAQHGTIPSLAIFAKLCGYAAKSWVAEIMRRLKAEGFLAEAPGRRLKPGLAFFEPSLARGSATGKSTLTQGKHVPLDAIDAASSQWATAVTDEMAEVYALAFRIVTIARVIEQGFRLESHAVGLNAGETLVLDALYRAGPPYESSAAQLRERFLISFAGIGKRLDRLQKRKYVERVTNPDDRRVQIVRLTPKGLELVRSTSQQREVPHKVALLSLSPKTRRQLSDGLRHLQSAIEISTATS